MKLVILFVLVICINACKEPTYYYVTEFNYISLHKETYDQLVHNYKFNRDLNKIDSNIVKYCVGKIGYIVGSFLCVKDGRIILSSSFDKRDFLKLEENSVIFKEDLSENALILKKSHHSLSDSLEKLISVRKISSRVVTKNELVDNYLLK